MAQAGQSLEEHQQLWPLRNGGGDIIAETAFSAALWLKEDLLLWEGHNKQRDVRQGWNCNINHSFRQQRYTAFLLFDIQTSLYFGTLRSRCIKLTLTRLTPKLFSSPRYTLRSGQSLQRRCRMFWRERLGGYFLHFLLPLIIFNSWEASQNAMAVSKDYLAMETADLIIPHLTLTSLAEGKGGGTVSAPAHCT